MPSPCCLLSFCVSFGVFHLVFAAGVRGYFVLFVWCFGCRRSSSCVCIYCVFVDLNISFLKKKKKKEVGIMSMSYTLIRQCEIVMNEFPIRSELLDVFHYLS